MPAKKTTIFGIFGKALKLYFSNFKQFTKYMTFPVLGQILGFLSVITVAYFYSVNIPNLIQNFQFLNNFNTIIACSLIITLPFTAVLLKAVWEYLIAYGAINSMVENMLKSGKVYDFDAHTELIKRRSVSFIGLWLIVGAFSLIAAFPPMWILAGIVFIYMVLIFQVFTFEPELSPIACVKKSFHLVKGHFASTFVLIAMVGLLTYWLLPSLVIKGLEYFNCISNLSKIMLPITNQIPFEIIDTYIKPFNIQLDYATIVSQFVITSIVSVFFVAYTLPLRSIMCALWYKELNGNFGEEPEKKYKRKTSKKRASENLMEKSHKKFAVKKLDRNILRRAMEKDDEE